MAGNGQMSLNLNLTVSRYGALRKRLFRIITVHKQCTRDELLLSAMRAYMVTQDSRNFYLLDVYANGEGDRDEEIEDPTPIMVKSVFRGHRRRPLLSKSLLY